ncbi:eukaryotic translation initiation factor [Echinococcus multilocularis]|uniref:Eukaryotic translation initiation factor n=1 Tax=Echinococcus multilocularis TaxID=6211 RepID=A0A0S4MIJ8_ECHMU|nr:eukaryotic translation initiation factor [Echinococcus multilocularis]CUT98641.1 eukaryotic translation initiation factor [Echinococcus multilocularis]
MWSGEAELASVLATADQNRFPVPKVQMDGCILDALVFAEWSSNIALTSKKEVDCDTTKATCGHASAEMWCPLVHVIFPPPLSDSDGVVAHWSTSLTMFTAYVANSSHNGGGGNVEWRLVDEEMTVSRLMDLKRCWRWITPEVLTMNQFETGRLQCAWRPSLGRHMAKGEGGRSQTRNGTFVCSGVVSHWLKLEKRTQLQSRRQAIVRCCLCGQ